MTRIVINIGLDPSPRFAYRNLTRTDVLNAAWDWLLTNSRCASVRLTTATTGEPTLVVKTGVENLGSLHELAQATAQDCVAWRLQGAHGGSLTGPHADLYEPFDPESFINE